MRIKELLKPKFLVAALLTAMALVAFNFSQPPLDTEQGSQFNAWYQTAADRLGPSADPKEADLRLSIAVTLSDPSRGSNPTVWNLPAHSLLDRTDRENTARILQLIRESGVFSRAPLSNPPKEVPVLTISVKDHEHQFETTLPLQAAEENIQLQNLLKLVEVYAANPPLPEVTPHRL
jgi:hypothetical protein